MLHWCSHISILPSSALCTSISIYFFMFCIQDLYIFHSSPTIVLASLSSVFTTTLPTITIVKRLSLQPAGQPMYLAPHHTSCLPSCCFSQPIAQAAQTQMEADAMDGWFTRQNKMRPQAVVKKNTSTQQSTVLCMAHFIFHIAPLAKTEWNSTSNNKTWWEHKEHDNRHTRQGAITANVLSWIFKEDCCSKSYFLW